ncbi:hypothetical protein B0H14DRAFT_2554600 [Mycena olivaceomarginata]|nr:hypothetical protein B0H14DRAFT_2554600 [Mycena olivaceomarginata]
MPDVCGGAETCAGSSRGGGVKLVVGGHCRVQVRGLGGHSTIRLQRRFIDADDVATDVEEGRSRGRDDSEAEVAGLELESGDAAVTMQAHQYTIATASVACAVARSLLSSWAGFGDTSALLRASTALASGSKWAGKPPGCLWESVGGDDGDHVGQRGILDGHNAPEIVCSGTQWCGHDTAALMSALVNMSKLKLECWGVGVGMNTLLECMGHESTTHLWLIDKTQIRILRVVHFMKNTSRVVQAMLKQSVSRAMLETYRVESNIKHTGRNVKKLKKQTNKQINNGQCEEFRATGDERTYLVSHGSSEIK